MDNIYIVKLDEGDGPIRAFSNPENAANTAKWLGTDFEILKVEESEPSFGWGLDGWVEVEWDRVKKKADKVVFNISKPRKILMGAGNDVYVERYSATKFKDTWVVEVSEESLDSVGELKGNLEKAKNILVSSLERTGGEAGLEDIGRFERFCEGVEEEIKRVVG